MTLAAPPVSPAALDYLRPVWLDQPSHAAASDRAYVEWEQAYDQLCTDAEAGVEAAVEARALIAGDVEAAIRHSRDREPSS